MKNAVKLFPILLLWILASCNSQKVYSDYDYSYSRNGGANPVYENFLIKDGHGHYSYEADGKKTTKKVKINAADLQKLEQALTANNFRMIQEDYKKLYDHVATSIRVKKGANAASKSDASQIMPQDQERWNNVVRVFQEIMNSKTGQ